MRLSTSVMRRYFTRHRTSTESISRPNVCIVGSGPAGFYTAKYLIKSHPTIRVTILEALPTPFGLVRYGVAPDHPEVKSVTNDFEAVAKDARVTLLANVAVESDDITINDLKTWYDAVVLAYGATDDKKLGIPGEDTLDGIISARDFVNWYNGHPTTTTTPRHVKNSENVVVIGQGNVSLDCARILLKDVKDLCHTDISSSALSYLNGLTSNKKISIVGRRGSAQAAFTIKELREISKITRIGLRRDELDASLTKASKEEISKSRAKTRIAKLFEQIYSTDTTSTSKLDIRFLLSPIAFIADTVDSSKVGAVRVERMELSGPPDAQVVKGTGVTLDIPASLVIRSIGYKVESLNDSLPLRDNYISNDKGRVCEKLYVVGWCKRGPSGIIGSNIQDAKETVYSILSDLTSSSSSSSSDDNVIEQIIKRVPSAITYEQVCRIHSHEETQGSIVGKPREKVVSIETMLDIANKN